MIKKKHPFLLIALLVIQSVVLLLSFIALYMYFTAEKNIALWLIVLPIIMLPSLIAENYLKIKSHYAVLKDNKAVEIPKNKFVLTLDFISAISGIVFSISWLYLSYMNSWKDNIGFWVMVFCVFIFSYVLVDSVLNFKGRNKEKS